MCSEITCELTPGLKISIEENVWVDSEDEHGNLYYAFEIALVSIQEGNIAMLSDYLLHEGGEEELKRICEEERAALIDDFGY